MDSSDSTSHQLDAKVKAMNMVARTGPSTGTDHHGQRSGQPWPWTVQLCSYMHKCNTTNHANQNIHQKQQHVTYPRPSIIIFWVTSVMKTLMVHTSPHFGPYTGPFTGPYTGPYSGPYSGPSLPAANFKISRANVYTLKPHDGPKMLYWKVSTEKYIQFK